MMNGLEKASIGALAVFTTCLLTGCIVSGNSSVSLSGQAVRDSSMKLLEPGVTTEEQVLELVGVPTRVVELDPNRKIYVYEWSRRESSSTAIFLLFSGSSAEETSRVVNIELVDGVVTRWWSETD